MNLTEGDRVYLVPTLPTAPTVCYSIPCVTVVSSTGTRARVRMEHGRELETDVRNIRRTRPRDKPPKKRVPVARKPLAGCEELTLW